MAERFLPVILTVALAACSGGDRAPTQPAQTEDIPAGAPAWIRANAIPFSTILPAAPDAELLPVKGIVGDARVVGIGEATHGTHEFFQMKHRMFEFLVRQMGFDVFAIEAEWTESMRVNQYVQTGQGDPYQLLTGLYFWTWRTQEVLDLIEWMRAWNADPAHARKLSFVGLDTQFPTLSMDTVLAYLSRADPALAATAQARYECLRPYANDLTNGYVASDYRLVPRQDRDACHERLQQVLDAIDANRARLEAATSPDEWSLARQAARVVVQTERVKDATGLHLRDQYMAENAAWWMDRLGPQAKMMVWAHNAHVMTREGAMGTHLAETFGGHYRVFGFRFYQGSFTAGDLNGNGLGTYSFGPPPANSYEAVFHAAGIPRFILDIRPQTRAPGAAWLDGLRPIREIGCCTRSGSDTYGVQWMSLPTAYHAIIYIDESTASQLLPPKYQ